MSLPFYRRFPRKFIEGTVGMPLEVKGGYSILLDLIYAHSGRLVDDPKFIAGVLGCSVRKWNMIRERLIHLGKIQAENGIISNSIADAEIESCGKFQDKQAENRARPNKNRRLKSPNHHLIDKDKDTPKPPQSGGLIHDLKEKGCAVEGRVHPASDTEAADADAIAWWRDVRARLKAKATGRQADLVTRLRCCKGRRIVASDRFAFVEVLEAFGPTLQSERAFSVLYEGGEELVFTHVPRPHEAGRACA